MSKRRPEPVFGYDMDSQPVYTITDEEFAAWPNCKTPGCRWKASIANSLDVCLGCHTNDPTPPTPDNAPWVALADAKTLDILRPLTRPS